MLLKRVEPPLYPSVDHPKAEAQWVGRHFPHVLVLGFVQREREGVVREVMCIGRLRERMAVAGKVD